MMPLALGLAFVSLALAALLAGLFFAFSMSVMRALDALGPDAAADAMRSINRRILNPLLFLVFLGTPLTAVAAGLVAQTAGLDGLWCFAAAAASFAGSFIVTSAVNVPMNNALEARTMSWPDYAPRWTAWNTVRTIASTASVLCLGASLLSWTV
jgi:uncharacterized membrane protein